MYSALLMGTKTPKIAPFFRDFVTLPKEDRATAISNMHKNLVKIARVVSEIFSQTDRQTDRHKRTNTQVYVLITILRNRYRWRSSEIVTRSLHL